ncbi:MULTISPECIES: DUF1828 domain-containing protein [Lactobacillus]|uniref:DUF1828 domain-containing protein n=1 Tax=Lactobacillus xujianguonis TaxID=2495899 RepID=A0A437SUP1_9LACO|nr:MULTISPECIES: DUF1828 domain-containing protein [Lactobacillus]RVU70663.1 DUF1828 domain-containing protein [Lactobacillus xujianguonis]RVU73263.1 DUF1828 domain-containing protein [Lactobacillus xujianguonis]
MERKDELAVQIKSDIGNWVTEHTEVVRVSEDSYEVATTQIDAYGDTVYCFVQEVGSLYQVSDDSHILFKLDPGQTDPELYQTAENVALGAGFDFDEKTCTISVTTDEDSLAQAVIRLAQLQVAISYLG